MAVDFPWPLCRDQNRDSQTSNPADLRRSLRGRGLIADMACDEAAWDLRNLWIGCYRDEMLFGQLQPLDAARLEAHIRRVNDLFLRLYGDPSTTAACRS